MDRLCPHTLPDLGDAGANTTECTGVRKPAVSILARGGARPWLGLLAVAAAVATAASSPTGQQQLLDSNATSWHRYVKAPADKKIAPARILSQYTTGNVTNADGLLRRGSNPVVLSRLAADDGVPTLVVDFGLNVAGQLSIDFAGSSNTTTGFPGITLAFSETLQYLSDRSDFTRSDNAGGVSLFAQPLSLSNIPRWYPPCY